MKGKKFIQKLKQKIKQKINGGNIRNIHDKFLYISDEAYKPINERESKIEGFKYDIDLSTKTTAVYVNDDTETIIIGHRGTVPNDGDDLIADAAIMTGTFGFSNRLRQSLNTVQNVIKNYPKYRIMNTGHSLGGKVASEIGQRMNKENTRVIAFNIGSTPFDIPKHLLNRAVCGLTNSDKCKKMQNQRIYTTGIDPISLSSIAQLGSKVVAPKKLNVHSLKNFK